MTGGAYVGIEVMTGHEVNFCNPWIGEWTNSTNAGLYVASISAQSKGVVLQKLHELRWWPIFLFLLFRLFIHHS